MSTKTKYVFKSILVILKNATIIIPLIEGVINAILAMLTPPPAEETTDEEKK